MYQKEKINLKKQLMDLEDIKIIKDPGKSAKNLKRPGIRKILALIEEVNVANLIVLKLDRLTRSLKDLEYLVEICAKHNVNLISIQEDFRLD